ncbi:MAG: YkgJ family cysteine cluster protein [Promethearchaeota archaeon]
MQEKIDLMNNKKFLRFKCTRCGRCCSDPNTFINITCFDIKRIIKGLRLGGSEILKYIAFYKFDDDSSTAHNLIERLVYSPIKTEKGIAFIGLLRNEDNTCIFLKNNSCIIYQFRPMICRSFPFTFDLKNLNLNDINADSINRIMNNISNLNIIYTIKGIEYCPGISKKAPIIKKKTIAEILNKTLIELIRDKYIIEKWNNAIEKNKNIEITAKNYILFIENFKIKYS